MFFRLLPEIFAKLFRLRADKDNKSMSTEPQPPPESEWYVATATVEGASHTREKLPNQDSVSFKQWRKNSLPIVLAMSDGHGGAKYFRSDIGSAFAVKAAIGYLDEFVRRHDKSSEKWSETIEEGARAENSHGGAARDMVSVSVPSVIARAVKEQVPPAIVREWTKAVKEHLRETPIEVAELRRLKEKDPKEFGEFEECETKYRRALREAYGAQEACEDEELAKCEAKLLQAYGATLMAAVVTRDYAAYWQLGDGDILSISSELEVTEVMPKDERLIANETTSLCSRDAWRDFRPTRFIPTTPGDEASWPALIMLSTDGYVNSYSSRQGFEKVARDLLEMMSEGEDGFEKVKEALPAWLKETSAGGSGDDISVGLILRRSSLDEVREAKKRGEEEERIRAEASRADVKPRPDEADGTTSGVAGESGRTNASAANRPGVPGTCVPEVAATQPTRVDREK
jgi:serine/threonine protein phosphatase PrpC